MTRSLYIYYLVLWAWAWLGILAGCQEKKKDTLPVPTLPGSVTVVPVPDPPIAKTMGFFLDSWQSKLFVKPPATAISPEKATATTTIAVDASTVITKIPDAIFGHNANTWMGPMVDQPLFLSHTTQLKPNLIRWPAGSGSNVYFWNQAPEELPADVPRQLIRADGGTQAPGYVFGKKTASWQASLEHYYQMLQATNSKGIITVNYGYARYGTGPDPVAAAAHLAAEWVRYDKGRTQYWEVGNENFGPWEWGYRINTAQNKDGQPELLDGKLYAQHFKVFADSMRYAARQIGKIIYIGAVTHEEAPQPWHPQITRTWNSRMMPEIGNAPDYYIVHHYFTDQASAAAILEAAATVPQKTMEYVTSALQAHGSERKPIALTEWNLAAAGARQQVSQVAGLFSVIVLGELLTQQFGLAARWDLLNGWNNGDDHGLFSDGNEPGVPKWTPRPAFFYLYYFQKLIGDRLIPSTVRGPGGLRTYATTYTSGEVGVTLVNTTFQAQVAQLEFRNFRPGKRFYGYSLEGGTHEGEFSGKVMVNGQGPLLPAGGPADYTRIPAWSAATADGLKVRIPGRGAVFMVFEKE